MRILLVAIIIVVISAATASAGTKPSTAIVLKPGDAISYGGMTCTAYKGSTPTNADMVCVRNDLKGYGVIISQGGIVVAKQVGTKFNIVFRGKNQ
jgi:hypothetical protein